MATICNKPSTCSGGSTPVPCSGGSTPVPCSGGSTPVPCSGGSIPVPCSGGSSPVPCGGGTTAPPITYTISYNANGGSGAPASQTKSQNVTLILSSIKPTRAGHEFLGWANSCGATSPSFFPGGSYYNNGTTTLFAVWKADFNPPTGDTMIPKKIYLSPENQNKSSINTISFYGTERQRMEELAKELRSYLQYRSCNVTLGDLTIGDNNTTDPQKRRDESNNGKYDFHICLHSNALDSVASGPRVFYLSGDSKSEKLAQMIYDKLFDLYKLSFPSAKKTDIKNTGADYLEVRETNAIAILVETAFHDVVADAQWIINNRIEIAKTIGGGIVQYMDDNNMR